MARLLLAIVMLCALAGAAEAQSVAFRQGYFDGCQRAKYDAGYPVIRIDTHPTLAGTRDYEWGWEIGYQACNVELVQEYMREYR